MVPSSLFCPKCGGLNEPGATTCFACGESMQAHTAPKNTMTINALLMTPKTLQERYHLIAQIGEGGFGAVYKAEDTRLGNRLVAIKEMKPSGLKPQELQEATEAFQREAELLTGLRHPSLPAIHDKFTEDGQYYLVMEFIEGRTLESYLAKAPKGRLPVREAFQIALKLCDVLEYLHSQNPPIIFRDLKPSNVMLTSAGQVYLIDFGIARHFKPGQSKDTTAFGTTGYAAPEQYGKAQTTPRSDIYSLGAVMHHMLTGDDPANSPFRFAPLLMPRPTGTWTFLRTMLEIDEYKRPADMKVVRQTFQRLADTWEAERQNGRITSMLPQYQAATGLLPAVRPGQTTQVPLLMNASTQAPPQIYPAQATPGQPPKKSGGIQPIYVIAAMLVIVIVIALIAAISSNNSNPPTPYNGNSFQNYATPTHTNFTPAVSSAAWSPDGTLVAFASGSSVQVWSMLTRSQVLNYTRHSASVLVVAWSPKGDLIASAGKDNFVQVWNAKTGTTIYTFTQHTSPVRALAWSPDGTRLASGGIDHTILVWNARDGKLQFAYPGNQTEIWAIAWSPNGSYVASAGNDALVQIGDATNGYTLNKFNGVGSVIMALAWSPDSTRLAAGGADSTVRVWDALTDANLLIYTTHHAPVRAVAWSPNGSYLASGGEEDVVQVWLAANGTDVYTYSGHAAAVNTLAWSRDSTEIASGSDDGTLRVWNAFSGATVRVFQTQP